MNDLWHESPNDGLGPKDQDQPLQQAERQGELDRLTPVAPDSIEAAWPSIKGCLMTITAAGLGFLGLASFATPTMGSTRSSKIDWKGREEAIEQAHCEQAIDDAARSNRIVEAVKKPDRTEQSQAEESDGK